MKNTWSWLEELTQHARNQGVREIVWLERDDDLSVAKDIYGADPDMDMNWLGFYCKKSQVTFVHLPNIMGDSNWQFRRYGGILLSFKDDYSMPYPANSKEETYEHLAFFVLCHELQHHLQHQAHRLDEPLEKLEIEADVVASDCLLSFKELNHLEEVKQILLVQTA